jgi:hypothetical protein
MEQLSLCLIKRLAMKRYGEQSSQVQFFTWAHTEFLLGEGADPEAIYNLYLIFKNVL